MAKSQYHLLKTQRFLPLFITQFFNAFNDNVFKNGLIILITYTIAKSQTYEQLMIAITGGIFILPFFLFSATAGQIADKFEKSFLIKIIKFFEIIFMLIGSAGFYLTNIFLLMTTLFFLGTHSTFFGPLKYSILPEHLKKEELIAGNALIEAGTFIAILVGSILGGVLIVATHGVLLISVALLSVALAGWFSSLSIPRAEAGQPNLKIRFNIFVETWRIIKNTSEHREVFRAVLGISWFWLVGSTFVTQIPSFTKEVLHAASYVVTLFFTLFSLGIAIGALLVNKLLKGEISAKYVPYGILGMSVFILDIFFATHQASFASDHFLSVAEFIKSGIRARILIDIILMSVCGGFYIVPLYAIIQERSEESRRSRVIACNNILNALFMVLSAIIIMVSLKLHLTIPGLFLVIAFLNIFVAIYIYKRLPN